jgi:hypothetical protein
LPRGGRLELYEDLMARALGAQERARELGVEAARIGCLSQLLREARTGGALLLHCAWCGKLEVGGEWLHLDAIGHGQTRIAEQLVTQSTHGICPECFERVKDEAEAERHA